MKLFKLLQVIAFGVLLLGQDVSAKSGGFSSSSSRSSSSSSRSFSSSSRPSAPAPRPSAPAVRPSTPSPSKGFSSNSSSFKSSPSSASSGATSAPITPSKSWAVSPQTSTRPTSKVDAARYKSAVTSGKAFTTRESAVADFKAKNATTYTSKFSVEPTRRPNYIPAYTNVGGSRQTIVYNNNTGGYGYWSGGGPNLGTFLLYDALSDAVMTNTLMSRQNYYVGPPVVVSPHGFWYYTMMSVMGLGALVVILAIGAAIKNS